MASKFLQHAIVLVVNAVRVSQDVTKYTLQFLFKRSDYNYIYYSQSFIPHTLLFNSSCEVVVKYVILLNVYHIQKGSHSGSVHSLLSTLTYLRWYHQVYQCYFSGLEYPSGFTLIFSLEQRYYTRISLLLRVRHSPPLLNMHLCDYLSSYWLISFTTGQYGREKTTHVVKTSFIVQ